MVMNKLMLGAAGLASVLAGMAAVPTPAVAQVGQGTILIYGNDPCPRENICIRAPESQRYRLPKNEQLQGTPQQRESWAQKSQVLRTVGNTGTMSCSAVGPGGHTGCLIQQINQARKETRQQAEDNQPRQ
jgi:hypothetical protein